MRPLTLMMTLLVRDEADIIADTIRFHHAQGVDRFIVMDNLSTDNTPRILRELAQDIPMVILHQEEDTYAQGEWVSQMARQAARDGADWVINGDADEFWLTAGADGLKAFLGTLPADVGIVDVARHNAVVMHDGPDPLSARSAPRETLLFETESLSAIGRPLPAKCLHRASALAVVRQGNHGVSGVEGRRIAAGRELVILHYPYRALPHYRHKVALGGAAYERNRDPALPAMAGATWREHYRQIDTGAVEAFWTGLALSRQETTLRLLSGALFREDRLVRFLSGETARQAALVAAHDRLCAQSRDLVEDFIHSTAEPLLKLSPEARPQSPLYYNIEFTARGARKQLETLRDLPVQTGPALLAAGFPALRDAFSLFPRNQPLRRFLAELLALACPEAVARLRTDCAGRRVVLHVTCHPRIALAEASVASFAALPDLHHLLLVGSPAARPEDETPLGFGYDGRLLSVPAPDNYEGLHRKLFVAFTLLDLVGDPALVVKIDDNILMEDAGVFGTLLADLERRNIAYAGRQVGAVPHPRQWHGWHLSKCEDPVVEARGYQYPLPDRYAAGGYGYVLGRRALAACGYMYLAMKEFFAMRAVGLEDAFVGHAAHAERIGLENLFTNAHPLALPGLANRDARSSNQC